MTHVERPPICASLAVRSHPPKSTLRRASVKLRGLRSETRLDIAQTLTIRHLRERHYAKLFTATKTTSANIAAMTSDNPFEARPRHEVHDL